MARNFQITGSRFALFRNRASIRSISTICLTVSAALLLGACQERNTPLSNELPPAAEAAVATLAPASGSTVNGEVRFYPEGNNVIVAVEATGLSAGMHGFHIHETGDCSAPDASSAGAHFAPQGNPHGSPTMEEPHHAGDMGNIRADDNGVAMVQLTFDTLSLDSPNSIVGKAVIIHGQVDDLQTQPSGNAGDPVACGVIQPPRNT